MWRDRASASPMENANVLPSPASSPSPKTLDMAVQPSRKRQRSQSMLSDASTSSVKRAVSDDVPSDLRSLRTETMSNLSLSDIDAYMSEQGESQNLAAIVDPSDATVHRSSPPAERLSIVMSKKQRQMEIGDTWYLIALDWWKRWHKACTGLVDKEGPVSEQELGPVNNASLLDEYGKLRTGMTEGVDMEYVPEDVWNSFDSWYGPATYPLPRQVIGRGEYKKASLELFPPHFLFARLVPEGHETLGSHSHSPLILSSGESVATLHGKLADAILPNAQTRPIFRVWCLNASADNHFESDHVTPRFIDGKAHLLEPRNVTLEEGGIEADDAFVVEFMDQAQHWIVDGAANKTKMQQRDAPPPIFNSSDGFFNRMSSASPTATRSITAQNALKAIGNTLSRPSLSTALKPILPGTLGLGNMGNTCFMNSALQCLAHSKELTDYFLSGVYEEELNPDNPLGMHGAIAETFGSLLQKIWASSSPSTSYSPREFKQQLQRFAPQFSGYQQHDSQELVAFLLDGLHEDLNRVLKKPYVEKPDWEGGGDLELVQLANKSWEGYKQRNDSVIVDLFQGQYQSTLVCPECKKVSITFDPFMYLTLPLPVKKKWRHMIRYVPWDSEKPHLKIPIEIDSDATFKEVRSLLGRWLNAPAENLLTLEVFSHRFYKNLDDHISVGEMTDNDVILCYELPCHAQQSRSYKQQPDDPLILPVYINESNPPNRSAFASTRNMSLIGMPTIAVFNQEEASDPNVIYDRVIERLHRWTRNFNHLYKWEATAASDIHKSDDNLTTADQPISEGDIADQKMTANDDVILPTSPGDSLPIRVGTKKDIFTFKIQYGQKHWGTTHDFYSNSKWETWEKRNKDAGDGQPILMKDDALICEFDENMKTFYFGDTRSQWDNGLFDSWEEFIHPEYEAAKKATLDKRQRGISLQDCLDEFMKEERLGEDDLWYCPRCKKHQQATKKFDLWNAPDILVVHLKRFSNSRTLRDKIDAFIDFPVQGLDLKDMVRERAVSKNLAEQGADVTSLNLTSLDEPLVYDLFGVDEHMGGLGGGHYRAYALNHRNGQWYHFDDSFVNPANAADAVNANAYLLFYRRRTETPLGGKTHEIIEAARNKTERDSEIIPDDGRGEIPMAIDTQLPTPPEENRPELEFSTIGLDDTYSTGPLSSSQKQYGQPIDGAADLSPPLDDLLDDVGPELLPRFSFTDKASPSSSNEALPDQDDVETMPQGTQSHWRSMSTDSMGYGSPEATSSSSSSLSSTHPTADDDKLEPVSKLSLVPVLDQEEAALESGTR